MKIRWLLFAIVIFALSAVSCSLQSYDKAFVSELDVVDALIAQNDTGSAIKALKKIEKKAFNSFSYIGIFRRYQKLGESGLAQKILISGLKKDSDNIELNAVYAHFLMRSNRLDEALPFATKLKNSNYASLYSEIILTKALSNEKSLQELLVEDNIPIFQSAYETSNNSDWIKNCAVILIKAGKVKNAALLQPNAIFSTEDAYFWGVVQYDSLKFLRATENLTLAQEIIASKKNKDISFEAQISLLKADSLLSLGEFDAAEQERSYLLSLENPSENQDYKPVVYVNSAFWAAQNNDQKLRYKMLLRSVEEYPEYIPGLSAYGNFAFESSLPLDENYYVLTLRKSGLKTIQMEQYDELPRASLADALDRINVAIKETNDPLLIVIQKNLINKSEKSLDEKKVADVWQMLESSSLGTNEYPSIIVHYALHTLLSVNHTSEAEKLYEKYIKNRYGFSSQKHFYVQLIENMSQLNDWECDFGAYFALQKKYVSFALRLYENAVQNFSEYAINSISMQGFSTAMNLAVLYSCNGMKQKALDLYSEKVGYLDSNVEKSEILYRIACLQNNLNKSAEALRSLNYSVSLNPLNEKAQFLLIQLR